MEISWTKLLGSSKTDKGNAIAFGSDGSIYIAGNTNGDLEDQINNGGYRDVFISKLDNNGDELWTKLLDGDGYEFPSGIVIGSDDSIYVTGRVDGNLEGELNNTVGNVFVHKINSDGDKLWTRLLGTSSSGNSAIAIGSDDSLYLTGCTFEDLDGELNNGQGDIFITKLNSDGYKQWTKLSGGLDHEQGNGIAIGSDGSIYITGYTNGNLEGQINSNRFYAGFISNYNSDGVRQWTKFIEPALDTPYLCSDRVYEISLGSNDDINLIGVGDASPSRSSYSVNYHFIAQYDKNGEKKWSTIKLSEQLTDIKSQDDDSIIVTGVGFVEEYTSAGDLLKHTSIGSSGNEEIVGIAEDNGDAKFSITGTASVSNILTISEDKEDPDGTGTLSYIWQSSSDGNSWTDETEESYYHIKFNDSEKYIRALISYEDDQGFSKTVTSDSSTIYITGSTDSNLEGQSNEGEYDVFISKLIIPNTDSIKIEKHSIQSSIESLEEELEEVTFSYDLPSYLVEGYKAYLGEEYEDLQGYDRFGTNSRDYLSSEGDEILWGLGGNDTLYCDGYSDETNFLLGGTGNDAYRIPDLSSGNIIIYEAPNHGKKDKIYLGNEYLYYGNFATIDKKHIFASDGYSNILIIDAKKNKGIEKINIGGREYTSTYFLNNFSKFPGYLGNISWKDLKPYVGKAVIDLAKKEIKAIRNIVKTVESSKEEKEDELNDQITSLQRQADDLDKHVKSHVSLILDDNSTYLTLTGEDNIDGTGNSLDNIFIGNNGNNTIDGKGGTDVVEFGNNKNDYTFQAIDNAVNDGISSFNIQGTQKAGSILRANEITTDPDSLSADSFQITSTKDDTSTDSLLNIEVLRFADGDYLTKNINSDSPDYSYSWQTSTDGVSWEEISDSSSFNVEAHLDGEQIRLVINYSDYEGFEEEITTDAITIPHLEINTPSSVLEGDKLSINIQDSSLKGETIYYSLSGSGIDEDDLSQGSLTGSALVKKNKFSIKHILAKDLITEGDETLELKLFTDADLTEQVGETKEITIEDVTPSYVIKTKSSITEGGTLKTSIRTTEVPNRTRLYWSLSGDDIDSDDVVGGNLIGSGIVKKGKLNLKHKLNKDLVTEGDETLDLKLFTDADLTEQVGETKEITIEDVIPSYAIKTKSSIAEGSTLKTRIRTRDVPNRTRLYWSLSGDDIDSDDVVGGNLTGSGIVKKGKLNLKHKLNKDLITEGDETLKLKLFTDADLTEQVGETKEVVILDKSRSQVSSARILSNSGKDKLFGYRGNDNLMGDSTEDYLYGGIGNEKLYGKAGNDTLFTREKDDLLYGGEGNDFFETTKGAGTDMISPYDNENDSTELLDKLKESDLTFGYIAGDTKIKDEDDLMAIVQNSIADDITFS